MGLSSYFDCQLYLFEAQLAGGQASASLNSQAKSELFR